MFCFQKVASKYIRTHAWQNAERRTSPCPFPLTVPSFIKRYKLFHWWRPSCPLTTSAVPRPSAVADQQAFRTQSRNCDWLGLFGCGSVITYKTHNVVQTACCVDTQKTQNNEQTAYYTPATYTHVLPIHTCYLYTRMYMIQG